MDQQFCCYSAATKAYKLKGHGNDSFAVGLNSSADTEVKWEARNGPLKMPYLTYGNLSLEEGVSTLC